MIFLELAGRSYVQDVDSYATFHTLSEAQPRQGGQ